MNKPNYSNKVDRQALIIIKAKMVKLALTFKF